MSEKVYEMLWDCQFCGTSRLLGKTHRYCPNCGAPQNPDSRYFPSDDEKVAVEDHIYVGRDVTCPACSQLNAGGSEYCQNCGAPLASGRQADVLAEEARAMSEMFQSSGPRDVVQERFQNEMERVGVAKPKRGTGSGPNKWLIAIIILAVLGVGAGIFLLNWKQETTVYVDGHNWERVITIDQYREFVAQSWRDVPPIGDNVLLVPGSCVQRQRSTRQVPDGQDCRVVRSDRGDGTFSERTECTTRYRSEPIYDSWCTWGGTRWEYGREVRTAGQSVTEVPAWGEFTLNCADQRRIGCERVSRRDETYNVLFKNESHTYTCAMPQEQWLVTPIESVWNVQVRVVDNAAADCSSLERVN